MIQDSRYSIFGMGFLNLFFNKTKGMKWRKDIRDGDLFLRDPRHTDLIIVLMGPTGSGKSTFINTLLGKEVAIVGHGLESETPQVQHYTLSHPDYPNNRILILDTPGFDDTFVDDKEILRRIAVWLAQSYAADMKIAGIIYLHDITRKRWQGSMARNFEAFKLLIGSDSAEKVVFGITMWDEASATVAEQRIDQLKRLSWRQMLEHGSTLHRVGLSQASARQIVDYLLAKNSIGPLKIQRELVDVDKSLEETQVGRSVFRTQQQILRQQEVVEGMLKTY
ncbi:hypothetical protein H0H92_005338 [Tricholoma furcatifolium]|nr:hypothetical protein H0H92_005338 [Tricholoma furcatifolium]